MDAGEVLTLAKSYVCGYEDDNIPIVVAVADLKNPKMFIELTIQRGYPLDGIWRDCGRPFGRYKNTDTIESDLNKINYFKWDLELHENFCKNLAYGNRGIVNISIPLSTGAGNILQNKGSVAFMVKKTEAKNKKKSNIIGNIYKVESQEISPGDSFACLVQYTTQNDKRYGIEKLSFEKKGNKWNAINKNNNDCTSEIDWALSGYPLILDGQKVTLRETATNVSDFRHIWQLPQLYNSLTRKMFGNQPASDVEFYYGLRWLTKKDNFELAVKNEKMKLPLSMRIDDEWINNFINLYGGNNLNNIVGINNDINNKKYKYLIIFDKDNLTKDFIGQRGDDPVNSEKYRLKDEENQVLEEGDFFIGNDFICFYLKPAIYPHHIIGVKNNNLLFDINIMGKPGRSGISIEGAKDLCKKIGLNDALIIDNGFDVIARMNEGLIICHKENTKPPRFTAAIHFGCISDSGQGLYGNHFEGIEMAYSTIQVTKPEPQKISYPLTSHSRSVKIFYSYAHEDKPYLDILLSHMKSLERGNLLKGGWSSKNIIPGKDWGVEITKNLAEAGIVIFLISKNFINSNYIFNIEIPQAEKQEKNETSICLPIIIDHCDWDNINFLRTRQVLPRDTQPLLRNNRKYKVVVQEIKQIIIGSRQASP